MKQSRAATVTEFLAGVPEDRRPTVRTLRALINKHLPRGYEEHVGWGMLCWSVPLSTYSDTYNGQPLMYVALANQKQYMSLHLMCTYMPGPVRDRLVAGFEAAGLKLDMGKACLRFKRLGDLPLDVIAETVGAVTVKAYVDVARSARSLRTNK